MEKGKLWEEYSLEDKADILNFWFYYYGGVIVTLDEIEKFRELAKERPDDIFNYIVTSSFVQNTIQTNVLVACMRQDKLDELFATVINYEKLEENEKEYFRGLRKDLITAIVKAYHKPEPPVPMDVGIVVEEGPNMGGK